MTQSVTPYGLGVKGCRPARRNPAQVLRECMRSRNLRISDIARVWDVAETTAARILNGERPVSWRRLEQLPGSLLVDWCNRLAASVEGRPVRSLQDETLDVAVGCGRLADDVRAALADGHLSDDERRRIRDSAAKLAEDLADVARCVG